MNLPLLLDVFDKCGTLSEKTESLYIEIDKAAEELGLTERVIEEIASRADALYQIGDLKMVNISETDKYIRKFQTTVHDDTDIEETKKLQKMKDVIVAGKGATIRVLRTLYSGSNVTIDDHHVKINDNHTRVEISKTPEGVKLTKING